MESVIFKQERALKGKILSTIVLLFAILYLFQTSVPILTRVIFLMITLLIFGFSISYKIKQDFNNQKLFSVFGIALFKTKLKLDFPDYISVFSASFKLDNEWGAVSAIGTKERHDRTVIRFFTGNKHFTLYKTEKHQKALEKANVLSKLLDVEIYEASKE